MNLEVSILTTPGKDLNIEKEIRLIKVALLYSDKITVVSPSATILMMMTQLGSLKKEDKINIIKHIAPLKNRDISPEMIDLFFLYQNIMSNTTLRELLGVQNEPESHLKDVEAIMKGFEDSFESISDEFYHKSKIEEILPLIDQGIIEFKHFDGEANENIQKFVLDEMINVLSTTSKYPLFDDLIERLAQSYAIEHDLKFNISSPKEIKFGKELLFKIPAIDSISLEKILEIKNKLERELLNFKNTILRLSDEIQSMPFSEETEIEIQKKYEYYIKPELDKLRDDINNNSFFKKFKETLMNDPRKYLLEAAVFIGVCDLFNFEKIFSGIGVLSDALYKTLKELKSTNEKIKEHPLFFYHSLNKIKF